MPLSFDGSGKDSRSTSVAVDGVGQRDFNMRRPSATSHKLPQNSENFFCLVHETNRAVRQSPSSFEGADDGTLFAI